MGVLTKNQFKSIFWSDKNNFITGLDPLGLQNASETAYSQILTGITNLTNRIRYYGFYCWLLEYYSREIRDTNPDIQNAFIRKAELQMAIIMNNWNRDYGQVPGSLFANELLDSAPSKEFSLTDGAVKSENNRTYWKFSSGAFGQYYVGAMMGLGLVIRSDRDNFICTQPGQFDGISGFDIANTFKESISPEARNMFIQNIISGILPIDDLSVLHSEFGLNKITPESPEWKMYLDILLQKDHPTIEVSNEGDITYSRKTTIESLLRFLQEDKSNSRWHAFLESIYLNKGKLFDTENETYKIWYFYQLNEMWQFAAGTVFWAMLRDLNQEPEPLPVSKFIDEILESIFNLLKYEYQILETSPLQVELDNFTIDEIDEINKLSRSLNDKDTTMLYVSSVAVIFAIYNKNRDELENLQKLALKKGLNRDGNVLEILNQISKFKGSLHDFIKEFLYRKIIYRHQHVALRKLGNGSQSTLKFLIENNHIRFIQSFKPQFTSPRLDALVHILNDLQLINQHNQLTEFGETYLKESLNGNF